MAQLLFDDLVRARQERRWDGEAEGPGRLHIYHQLKLRGLLDWQLGGFGTLQDAVSIFSPPTKELCEVRAVREKAAAPRLLGILEHHRKLSSAGEVDHLPHVNLEDEIAAHDHGVWPLPLYRLE